MKKKPIKYYRPTTPVYFDVGFSAVVFILYTEQELLNRSLNPRVPNIQGRYQITSHITKLNRKTGEFWTVNSHFIPKEPL